MKLYDLLGAYDFDEIMPVIVDMFPGTGKFRHQLKNAYRLLMGMRPVPSKKSIRFRVIHIPDSNESYMGAVDADFATTNVALTGRHPKVFDDDYKVLSTPDR